MSRVIKFGHIILTNKNMSVRYVMRNLIKTSTSVIGNNMSKACSNIGIGIDDIEKLTAYRVKGLLHLQVENVRIYQLRL